MTSHTVGTRIGPSTSMGSWNCAWKALSARIAVVVPCTWNANDTLVRRSRTEAPIGAHLARSGWVAVGVGLTSWASNTGDGRLSGVLSDDARHTVCRSVGVIVRGALRAR